MQNIARWRESNHQSEIYFTTTDHEVAKQVQSRNRGIVKVFWCQVAFQVFKVWLLQASHLRFLTITSGRCSTKIQSKKKIARFSPICCIDGVISPLLVILI